VLSIIRPKKLRKATGIPFETRERQFLRKVANSGQSKRGKQSRIGAVTNRRQPKYCSGWRQLSIQTLFVVSEDKKGGGSNPEQVDGRQQQSVFCRAALPRLSTQKRIGDRRRWTTYRTT
jgi:hypothetical protein